MSIRKNNKNELRVIFEPPDSMRRKPKQDRSKRVVDNIVTAAFEILQQYGRDGLSTSTLELVSGVPKSTIYEYFPSLDAVVAEVFHFVIRSSQTEGYSRYPLEQQTIYSFVVSIVNWVLEPHYSLLKLDSRFYHSYSGFYDLWQEFDNTFQDEDTTANFLTNQLRQCSDFKSGLNDHMFSRALGRSVLLTTNSLLHDEPTFIDNPEFKKMLVRISYAIFEN